MSTNLRMNLNHEGQTTIVNDELLQIPLFFMRYRLTPRLVEVLLQIVGRHLKPKVPTNHALSETKKLLIFLRFVASNQFYYELEDTEG